MDFSKYICLYLVDVAQFKAHCRTVVNTVFKISVP